MADGNGSIVRLFEDAARGDGGARDALFSALYRELHRLAEVQLHRNGGSLTLSATTLIHEAYLGMAERSSLAFPTHNQFLAYASRAMRGLIVDYVRRRQAVKRGGELTITQLDEALTAAAADSSPNLDSLSEALDGLASLDAALAELVDLKFFCGLSLAEIAGIRGTSERTVQRDWAKARAFLHKTLSAPEAGGTV